MPKRKRPEERPEDQFKRFVEAAREHGVEENADELDREFKRLSGSTRSRLGQNSSGGKKL